MFKLLKLLSIKKIVLATAANITATICGLILMAASAWLITSASFHPPLSNLAVGITLVRAAGIFRAVFRYLDRYLSHTAIFAMLTELRVKLYKSAFKKFPSKSGATGEAELLHDLIVGVDILKDFLPRVLQPILCSVILTAAVTFFLFKIIGNASFVLPLTLILTLVIPYIFTHKSNVNDTDYREILLDMHEGREELQIAGAIPIAVDKLNAASEKLSQNYLRNVNHDINVDTACQLIITAALIFILHNLISTVGLIDLAMWFFILTMTLETFNILPSAVRTFINMNWQLIDDSTPPVQSFITHSKSDLAVNISDLNFSYTATANVINHFNFKVKRGEKVAIIGESGSGKTTLLYLMLGLWKPDSGEIEINGTIAAATTRNYIFAESIRENFKILYPNITQEEIETALRICQLTDLDIDTNIGENATKISGGERCRLQSALAVASNSDILILDEPTAGLDKGTAQNLISETINYATKKDRTLIIITHDLLIANMMNFIVKLV